MFFPYAKRIPFTDSILISLMFGWLKMSELCSSPFDGDDHYDVDVDTEKGRGDSFSLKSADKVSYCDFGVNRGAL